MNCTRANQSLNQAARVVEDLAAETAEKSGSTSLVKYRHIGVFAWEGLFEAAEKRCPRTNFDLVNTTTGERIPGRCKAYGCTFCGPKKLWLLQMALTAAKPERFVTLTWAPADPTVRRKQVDNLMRSLRKDGYRSEMASCVEENPTSKAGLSANPKATDFHIHGLQKGDYIPQRVLQEKWGGRVTHIEKVGSISDAVESYMLKQKDAAIRAAGYELKHQGGRGRPVNITRGFFDGLRLGDVKENVRAVLFDQEEEKAEWVRVTMS